MSRRWPDLMAIVESKVKPERMKLKRKALRERWWQLAEKRPALQHAIEGLDRVLVQCRITSWLAFALLDSGFVYDISLNVFPTRHTVPAVRAPPVPLPRDLGAVLRVDTGG